MRYWAYFLGKMIAVAALSQGIYLAIYHLLPAQQEFAYDYHPPRFVHDLWFTVGIGVLFLLSCGLLYGAIWDQRYRCRVCLRRMRMPIETGSRGFMLQMGRPRTEYICPYGHGTLKQEEFQTSALENPEWTSHSGDMWEELYAASKQARDDE